MTATRSTSEKDQLSMTVEQIDVIDFVAHHPGRDEVLLVIIEHRRWGDRGALLPALQAKLNTYLAYALGGQLTSDYAELFAKPIHIQLRAIEPRGIREAEFLRIVSKEHFQPAGIRFSWKITAWHFMKASSLQFNTRFDTLRSWSGKLAGITRAESQS